MNVQITLPSNGRRLDVSPMTTKQVDKLISPKYKSESNELFFRDVIPSCLGIPFSEYAEFLIGDETSVIAGLFEATFGKEVKYKLECPNCSTKQDFVNILENVPAITYDPQKPPPTEGLSFEYQGTTICFHLLRVRERLEAAQAAQAVQIQTGGEEFPLITFSLAAHIDSISAVKPAELPAEFQNVNIPPSIQRVAIQEWVQDAPFGFVGEFKKAIEEHSCGLDLEAEHNCPKCGEKFREEVPLLPCFFSGTGSQKGRRLKTIPSKALWVATSSISSSNTP